MRKYRISSEANQDLEDIWSYTYENWSEEQANRYQNLILDEIEYIAENPMHGRPYVKREGYRIFNVKSHRIYYKILDDDAVRIVRILHKQMDVESRLSE